MSTSPSRSEVRSLRYCGREFTASELDDIRRTVAAPERPNRTAITRAVCGRLRWLKPGGDLQLGSCGVALRRMQADGLIELPETRSRLRVPEFTAATDPGPPVEGMRGDLGPLQFRPVREPAQSRLWRERVARYHYAGYRPLPGAQLRYLVYADGHLLAALGFGAAAWRLYDRDKFIGWTPDQRIARTWC